MARYQGRHAPRHARPRPAKVAAIHRAVARPAMGSSLSIAVVATATAGVAAVDPPGGSSTLDLTPQAQAQAQEMSAVQAQDVARLAADRSAANVSRSAVREQQRRADIKAAAEAAKRAAEERARAAAEARRAAALAQAQRNPRGAAQALLGDYGFSSNQWGCLDSLWNGESGWNYRATNAYSGAYGIPQSLPGYKMASAGSDWATNPVTQIRWGLGYIKRTYGTPCNAYYTWLSRSPHWY